MFLPCLRAFLGARQSVLSSMEFAQLIAPAGPWNKVWLAAHWDRKLKKSDYLETDLRKLIKQVIERRALVTLRATGHLLVGICKVYARKCLILDDEAAEVRTRLMLAFNADGSAKEGKAAAGDKGDKDGHDVVAGGAGAAAGAAGAAILREVGADGRGGRLVGEKDLVAGRRHMARLEDITLKPRATSRARREPLLAADAEDFGAMTGAEMEAAMKDLKKDKRLFPSSSQAGIGLEAFEDTMPLVAMGSPGRSPRPLVASRSPSPTRLLGAMAESSSGVLLDMDLEPAVLAYPTGSVSPERLLEMEGMDMVAQDDEPHDPDAAAEAIAERGDDEEPGHAPLVVAERIVEVKRRRKTYFIFDEATEIPKEQYQGYVNDRTAITRKNTVDYSVFIPHYAPGLPNFTTTFTDLCPSLMESLRKGSEVADKRRRLMAEAERSATGGGADAARQAAWAAAGASSSSAAAPGEGMAPPVPVLEAMHAMSPALTPLFSPLGEAEVGLRSPTEPVPVLLAEKELVSDAPASFKAVITGGMDAEDQSGNSDARVGYSGRTEKMHRFLAKEFKDTRSKALSYEGLCKSQAGGRKDLIAGTFFELLVLKTNGVIGLKQDGPQADIKITKASSWAR